jgi:hypothetical protein
VSDAIHGDEDEPGPELSREGREDKPARAHEKTEAKSGLLDELLDLDGRNTSRSVADAPSPPTSAPSTRLGRLVAWAAGEAPTVEFAGNDRGPLAARSIIPLHPSLVAEAIADRRGVLLSFEDGRPDAPIITGLMQPLLHAEQPEPEDEAELELQPTDAQLDARVDGRRVEIEAADELVLRCGQASIVMRRNGRVVIRGTYVETRSRGVNRVKGGSVEIN